MAKTKYLREIIFSVIVFMFVLILGGFDGIGEIEVFAEDGELCVETDCTGTYSVDGFCSEVDTHYQSAVQSGVGANQMANYIISNAGQLYWFANHVNTGDYRYNAELSNNITINNNVLDNLTLAEDGTISDNNGAEFRV